MKRLIQFLLFLLPFCLSAQIHESFNGPDISSANKWIQKSNDFYLENGQLLCNISGRSKGVSFIRTYTPFSEEMEWLCDCSFTFNPTNSNHARIYVYITNPPCEIRFFIKIGNSLDNVSLYSQEGDKTPVLLIEGREGILDNNAPFVRVKLTFENHSKWTLFTSTDNGKSFYKEGEYEQEIKDPREGCYLNLAAHYSAKSYKDAYIAFDNLIVNNKITHDEPTEDEPEEEIQFPFLEIIQPLSTNSLQLEFDKPIEIDDAVFSLSELGKASIQEYIDEEERTDIRTVFDGEMKINHEYTLSIEGLKDLAGNNIPNEKYIFELIQEDSEEEDKDTIQNIPQGSILINEIMANPKGLSSLPETEYIELYNSSNNCYNLEYCTFIYGETNIILPNIEFPAHSYAVLFRSGRKIDTSNGIAISLEHFPAALANTGKELQLTDANGNIIDKYTYPQATPAKSWERSEEGWHLCSDSKGGTPGDPNSNPKEESEDPDEPDTPDEPDIPDEPDDPEHYTPGSVILNEIMANPSGLIHLPETEYIEILNTTNTTIHLKDWILQYGDREISLVDKTLPPNEYAVIFRSGNEIKAEKNAVFIELEKFPAALNNQGGELKLYDATNTLIDKYSYPQATPAKSWERSKEGWHLCSDSKGGTPGTTNSDQEKESEDPKDPDNPNDPDIPDIPDNPDEPDVPEDPEEETEEIEAGEIIFNELLPNPYSGGSEYIELYNISSKVLPLKTLALSTRKKDGKLSTCYPLPDIDINPNGYIVLTKEKDGVLSFYTIMNESTIIEIKKIPILANTASDLVLYRQKDQTVIDEVHYSRNWHMATIKDERGVALERIVPKSATQDPNNWTSAASSAGFGTPGYENSQLNKKEDESTTGIETPIWTGGNDYNIRYQLEKAGYHCRIFIFNTSGQRIAEIINNESLGTNGSIYWDGTSAHGQRLSPGVYIFFAELYHPTDGTRKQYKNVFLIH